jgi:myo-inositol 2-dehydrogenase/D-chiro-inositol 1-dehydrogenase
MPKQPLRVALVGYGFMGRAHSNAYRQAPHFFDLPFDIECKLICGRNREALRQTAAAWGWEEMSSDWREAVTRPDIDLVDIAAPNVLHAPIAVAAAEAGKMVLCEKPLATSLEEARRMAAAAAGVPNLVWFNYRRVPAVAFAQQLLAEGKLGRIFHYRATYLQEWGPTRPPGNWKLQKEQAGSGVLGDLASHLVDTALWLNGPVSAVSAMLHTFAPGRDVDDAALFLARFANGSLGSFEATRFATGCRNRNAFEIHGERGMLRFDLENLNHLEYLDAADARAVRGPRRLLVTDAEHPYAGHFWKPGHVIGYEHTFIAALADFLFAAARGESAHPDFADALRVQTVLDAAARSAVSGAWEAAQ